MKSSPLLLPGTFLLLISGLLTLPAARAGVIGKSPEISAGREAASMVEKVYTVDKDPLAVARVRGIGRRLAACAKDADYPFEFHVIDEGEVNAFALPGGFVYVFRGLLQLLPNDDALAFVLAHEVSHVTRHHAVRQFEKNFVLNVGLTAALAGTGAGYNAYTAADVTQALAGASFTRHDEAEADAVGIDLVTRAGYNPRAAAESMQVVKRATGDDKHTPSLIRTHPAPDSRIRRLNELAAELVTRRTSQQERSPAVSPPPPASTRRLSGLEGVRITPCDWMPLRPGARWEYRLTAAAGGSAAVSGNDAGMTVQVLEQLIAEPSGVFRVETDLGRGVRSTRLLAPAGDRYLSRAELAADGPWRLEALFPGADPHGAPESLLRCGGVETVKVPAGEFEAVRVDRLGPDGRPEARLWYARGVGLVKRESLATGVLQELCRYHLPVP